MNTEPAPDLTYTDLTGKGVHRKAVPYPQIINKMCISVSFSGLWISLCKTKLLDNALYFL